MHGALTANESAVKAMGNDELKVIAAELVTQVRKSVTIDKDSGIRNDPNDWAKEHNQPRYIIDLQKRIITVSIETMKIVNALPPLNEKTSAGL